MGGIIEMLKDFKDEIDKVSKKSPYPWNNIYRKYKKKKMINEIVITSVKECDRELNYENTRNLAVVFNNLQYLESRDPKVFIDPINNKRYSYIINRCIIGNYHNEFNFTLIPLANAILSPIANPTVSTTIKPDDNIMSINYVYIFSHTGQHTVARTTTIRKHGGRENITRSRVSNDALTGYFIEYNVFMNTVVDNVKMLIKTFLEN